MVSVALLPHPKKQEALEITKRLIDRLESRQAGVWLEPEIASLVGRPDLAGARDALAKTQVAFVMGGDGAFLKAARMAAPHGVPIIGVNVGHLGFLTVVEPAALDDALDRVLRGAFDIEERLMLRAAILKKGETVASFYGLNDAVVTRGVVARVIELEVFVDDALYGSFSADGMIVSTPTGSTAYSLSAGGPIVNPGVEAFIVAPICAHTIGARALVIRPDEKVRVRVGNHTEGAMLTVDGQVGQPLEPGDEVWVEKASRPARLVRLNGRNFYRLLRDRLRQDTRRTEFESERLREL